MWRAFNVFSVATRRIKSGCAFVVIEGEFDQAASGFDRRIPTQVQFALEAADIS
jgi:hypothetical protein